MTKAKDVINNKIANAWGVEALDGKISMMETFTRIIWQNYNEIVEQLAVIWRLSQDQDSKTTIRLQKH